MTINEIDNIRIFFIIGRPRSGTTLLRTLFDAHSNVSIPYEGRVITDLYYKYYKIKKWDKNILLNFYDDLLKTDKVEHWEFNNSLKEEILSLGKEADFERLIKIIYINFVSLYDKDKVSLIGDKNPFYAIRKPYLKIFKKIFPDAKIIHLTRDYRAQYSSMINMDFENPHPGVSSFRWKYSFKIVSDVYKDSENYLRLKHEDLTENPSKWLQILCDFLDIEYQEKMLEFYKIKDFVIEKYGDEILKVHSSLFNPIRNDFNEKWKLKLDSKTIKYLDASVGKTAEYAGYKRMYDAKQTKVKLLFYKLHTYLFLIYANLLDSLPLKLKRYFLGKTDSLASVFNIFLKK